MAKKVYEEEKIRAIATKIREKAANNKTYTTEEMPSGIDDVYNEGYDYGYEDGETDGFNRGRADGIEAGKKSQYDEFWDNLQENGKKTNYSYAFAYSWNDTIFCPKYDMKPTEASGMFFYTPITDLVEALNRCGRVLDTSNTTTIIDCFYNSKITHVGTFDWRKMTSGGTSRIFRRCAYLHTVDKIIVSATVTFSGDEFGYCTLLKNITFEGTIGQKGLSFSDCTALSKASITSIINALSTSVSASSGYSITLSKTAVNKAFETSSGANNGYDSDEFRDLVLARNNWTINLV